jgi:hypothetical protein
MLHISEISCTFYSIHQIKPPKNLSLILLQEESLIPKLVSNHFKFKQKLTVIQVMNQIDRVTTNKIIQCPTQSKCVIEDPIKYNFEKIDIIPNKVIETPKKPNIIEKYAVRLIVIRRKKIKKHKRKKFLKRMRAVIEKQEVRRKQLKKKIFEAEFIAMTLKAEKFNAEKYVKQRIELLTKTRLPSKHRGEYLPEEMILKFIKQKEEQRKHKQKLHNYRLKID